MNFEKYFRTLLLYSTSDKLLFHVQVAKFQLPDIVKNCSAGAFQAFYARSKSSHSKAFTYLKSLETVFGEVARCQPATLGKKLFPTFFLKYFAFIFSECIMIVSFEDALKVCVHNFSQEI